MIPNTNGINPDHAMINHTNGETATPNKIPFKMGFLRLRIEITTVKIRIINECHPMMVEYNKLQAGAEWVLI